MRRGAWHQFGDRSQRLVLEQLDEGQGVGVIISPRDLAPHKAEEYAPQYIEKGADLLVDQQFYVPDSDVGKLSEYGTARFRASVADLGEISDADVTALSAELRVQHQTLGAHGVIAPALVYQAGRPDIVDVNGRLFAAAKAAGDELGIPTYATVVVGLSASNADTTMDDVLSQATSLDSDGWYFAFEFEEPRIPANAVAVRRACEAGLLLAATGKPVMHAFAGPLGLLSLGFGATAVGIGHSQNLWQFTLDRWHPVSGGGGGGDAPPRFFSSAIWGTIVYPDEIAPLSPALRNQIVTGSPFSDPVTPGPPYAGWSRWESNKHLVYKLCEKVAEIAESTIARECASAAVTHLDTAVTLLDQVEDEMATLADNSGTYQQPWRDVMRTLLNDRADDYDFLEL